MRKRQKLVLLVYTFAVFTVSFVLVPYTHYASNGSQTFLGHRLKPIIREMLGMKWQTGSNSSVDAQVMIAEVISLTAIAAALILILRRS